MKLIAHEWYRIRLPPVWGTMRTIKKTNPTLIHHSPSGGQNFTSFLTAENQYMLAKHLMQWQIK